MNENTSDETEITPDEALKTAISLHQSGRLDDAEGIYALLLDALPDWPEVLHFYGVLKHQRNENDQAVDLISRALQLAPNYPDAHSNLGNIHKKAGRPEAAIESYRNALNLQPDNAIAHSNMGLALNELKRFEEAVEHFQQATRLMPNQAEFHSNLGRAYKLHGDFKNAAEAYRTAIGLRPYCDKDYEGLCVTLYLAGENEAAIPVIKQWLELDPDHPYARHRWASMTGQDIPERASDDYVARHFDDFAEHFDYILKNLDYKVPFLVRDALAQLYPKPNRDLAILDAGCGTGLCAAILRPYAGELIGVDLSENMLSRAHDRQQYDQLFKAELTEFLNAHLARFDLIVSADTLCYFGELSEVISAARKALQANGRLLFTVERIPDDSGTYQIQVHGRYSHGREYVQRVLREKDFASFELNPVLLRYEAGKEVNGWLVDAQA